MTKAEKERHQLAREMATTAAIIVIGNRYPTHLVCAPEVVQMAYDLADTFLDTKFEAITEGAQK